MPRKTFVVYATIAVEFDVEAESINEAYAQAETALEKQSKQWAIDNVLEKAMPTDQ